MAARFWVGGAGTWDGSATTHWAASSGGASGASAPTVTDDATFDASSGLGTGVTVTIASGAACNNLTITGPAGKNQVFTLSANFAPAGTVALNANSTVNRIRFQSSIIGTARTITAASLTATGVLEFMDITGAGAATWSATASGATAFGDCGGNSGITFDASVAQAWSGNTTGSWSTAANWTSRVPLPQDDVTIGALTSGTVTCDMPTVGRDLSMAGSTGGTLNFTSNTLIMGNVTCNASVAVTGTATTTLGGRGTQTITTNTRTFTTGTVTVSTTASYAMQDDYHGASLSLRHGTLLDNGHTVSLTTTLVCNSGEARTLNLTGNWVLSNASGNVWTISTTALTVTSLPANISITDTGASGKTFGGGGLSYNALTVTGGGAGAITITGANSFSAPPSIGSPKTVIWPASTTNTFRSQGAIGTGSSGNLITFQSSTPGTRYTLSCPSGTVTGDWMSVTDCAATGGAAWFLGSHSSGSNNTGLQLADIPTPQLMMV